MLRTSDLEIEQYLKDISNKRGVTQKIHFGQKLVSGYWSESESRWHLRTESGREYVAQYIVSGVGALHIPNFPNIPGRSEEHTSELQSLMRISYAVFCLKKKKNNNN